VLPCWYQVAGVWGGHSCAAVPAVSQPYCAGISPAAQVRVAIIGNVDSGKSTMVGVLTRSMLDDGRGLARSKVSTARRVGTQGTHIQALQ
jgi:GTPase